MAVVHQSFATANGTGTSVTLTKPAGVTAGDLLLAAFLKAGSITAAPAGWTLALAGTDFRVYYRVADGTEGASFTWTQSVSGSWRGGISRYSGVSNASPIDAGFVTTSGVATTGSAGPVTTTTANAMVIGGANSGQTTTPPASLTERWESTGGGLDIEHASAIQAAAGSTGSKTWTFAANTTWEAWLAALTDANASATISSPTFIASSEQVFSPAVVPTLYINASFVPTGEQAFAPQVLGPGQVGPNFVASEQQVFAPSVQVTAGPQAATPNFVSTGAQVFSPQVIAARQISPGFVSEEQVFLSSVSLSGLAPTRLRAVHEAAVHVVVDHEPAA